MKYIFILKIAVLVHLPLLTSKESGTLVVLKHSVSFANKKYVDKILVPRKPINRTTSLTSTDIYFRPNVSLDSPMFMRIITYRKFITQYKPFMIDIKGDVCDVLKFQNHPLYKFFMSDGESNLLDPCPLKGHRYVKPYYTSYNNLPHLLPVGMWRIDITITKGLNEDDLVLGVRNYYEITATGIDEF